MKLFIIRYYNVLDLENGNSETIYAPLHSLRIQY